MPTNLELKAKYPNIKRAESIARELSETEPEILEQIDTYYNVPHGRLKLRQIHSNDGISMELIWYDRNEAGGERISNYERVELNGESGFYKILEQALEIDVKVEKQRTVYIWNGCRIHIDIVEQLGHFLEFEVLTSHPSPPNERLQHLTEKFGITDLDIINCSYADLLRTQIPDY